VDRGPTYRTGETYDDVEEQEDGLFVNLKDPDFAAWLKAYNRANTDYEEVLRELAR
jgi:hypothetical protein